MYTFGHLTICIDGVSYLAHRLAWLWMTGEWPKAWIDHANRFPDDNRWSNLREATGSQNKANGKIYSNNKSGFKGVRWHYQPKHGRGKWLARIGVRGQRIHLGCFDSLDQAAIAYAIAADKYFGEFAHAA